MKKRNRLLLNNSARYTHLECLHYRIEKMRRREIDEPDNLSEDLLTLCYGGLIVSKTWDALRFVLQRELSMTLSKQIEWGILNEEA